MLWALRIMDARSTGGSGLAAFDGLLACLGVKKHSPSISTQPTQGDLEELMSVEDADVAAERRRLQNYEPQPGTVNQVTTN